MKTLKIGNFEFFVIFGVNLRYFQLENCNKLFENGYWSTHVFLVDPFQRSNPQSPSEIWKKVPKNFENKKTLEFANFGVNLRHFHFEKAIKLVRKDYWITNAFLVDLLKLSNSRSLSKIWRKMRKNFENWRFWGFLSFSVSIWDLFHLENSTYLFGNVCWATISYLVDLFQRSSSQNPSKILEKMHKTFENWKFLGFLSIGILATIYSEKPNGQQISTMLSIFSILFHEVYQKFDEICTKLLKIGKFLVFCHFWVFFFPKKNAFISS